MCKDLIYTHTYTQFFGENFSHIHGLCFSGEKSYFSLESEVSLVGGMEPVDMISKNVKMFFLVQKVRCLSYGAWDTYIYSTGTS